MIDKLNEFEASQLENWYSLSLKKQKKFCKKLVAYAEANSEDFKAYVNGLVPNEGSSLCIVFEALSIYSKDWNEFLVIQIKRLVEYADQSEKSSEVLDLLSDLDLQNMYSSDYQRYKCVVDFIFKKIEGSSSKEFKLNLQEELEIILIEVENEESSDYLLWNERIKNLKETQDFPSISINDKIDNYAKTISSKLRIWPLMILSLGFFACLALSSFFFIESMHAEKDDLSGISASFVLFVVALSIGYCFLKIKVYELDKAFVKIKSIFGKVKKTIRRKDIESYVLLEKKSKYESWKELFIFTHDGTHKLYSYYMHAKDFNRFRSDLIHGVKKDNSKKELIENRSSSRVGKWVAVICFSLSALLIYHNVNKESQAITDTELIEVSGTVSNELEIERRKSSRWIDIELEEFPGIVFKIAGFNFKASAKGEILTYFKTGTPAELAILTRDFETKISGSTPRSFREKVFYNQNVHVYELYQGDWSYMSLEYANQLRKENVSGWLFWVITAVLGFFGVLGIKMMVFYSKKSISG